LIIRAGVCDCERVSQCKRAQSAERGTCDSLAGLGGLESDACTGPRIPGNVACGAANRLFCSPNPAGPDPSVGACSCVESPPAAALSSACSPYRSSLCAITSELMSNKSVHPPISTRQIYDDTTYLVSGHGTYRRVKWYPNCATTPRGSLGCRGSLLLRSWDNCSGRGKTSNTHPTIL
jgi:hypothetical protein